MTRLVDATLRAAETVKSLGRPTGNPLQAIIAYLEPILQDLDGHIFDPKVFSSKVREAYGWNFNEDAAEGFRLTLRTLKYLQLRKDSFGSPVADQNGAPVDDITAKSTFSGSADVFSKTIEDIVNSFREFVDSIRLNEVASEISDDTIVDNIVSYVLDSFKDENEYDVGEGEDFESLNEDRGRYLSARYVKWVMEGVGELREKLEQIFLVGLVAELADDIRSPQRKITRSTLRVFLDSPVALDLLGTSGAEAAETTRSIISKLQDLGCKIEVFHLTRQELVGTLFAVVNKELSDRSGITAEALISGEVEEEYVWSIISDPENALREYGITVRTNAMDSAVSINENFTATDYDKLYAQYLEPYRDVKNIATKTKYEKRCRHDTSAAALVCRMRGEDIHSDIFQSGFIFLTRNRGFARIAKNYCIHEGIIDDSCVGPFITMHELAASLWLRTGMQDSVVVPRKHLLASCARVLARNERVIRGAKRAILSLKRNEVDEKKARMLEAVLMQDRSMLLVSDRIRGGLRSISVEDIR